MNDRDRQPLGPAPDGQGALPPDPWITGPGLDAPKEPDGRELLRRARRAAAADQNRRDPLARRLFGALIAIALIGVVFFVVLPRYGLALSPVVPVLCFIAILAGTVLSAIDISRPPADDEDDDNRAGPSNEGRPVGCCPGPRPMRCLRK